ncbi:hypothetical protein [Prosthecobacter sp.]|uniref:hypothetical protein n=1 Tax=Prosthecobacter sp. TaxID=1965333 RepID=UPI003784FEA8
MLLLSSCASDTKPKATQRLDFETWCLQSKLEYVSPPELSAAKASEVPVQKLAAQLGGGLTVKLQCGIKIKSESSFSTTSYYELRDAKGSSLAKFPSRISPPGFEGNFRLWSSPDSSLILIYEWIVTGVDSHEMYFVFHKEESWWSARGVKIPLFPGSGNAPSLDDPNERPGNTGPYGPHVLGVSGRSLIIIPKYGKHRRARFEDMEAAHPFPFIVG